MSNQRDRQLRRIYLGDYIWGCASALIVAVMALNLVLVFENPGSLVWKLAAVPFGTWFYWTLISWTWRQTAWGRQKPELVYRSR